MGKATHDSALCCKEKTKGSPKTPPIREIWGYRANAALKNGRTVHTWCLRPHKCAQQIHHSKSSPLQCVSLYAHWNRRGVRPLVWDQWCETSGVRTQNKCNTWELSSHQSRMHCSLDWGQIANTKTRLALYLCIGPYCKDRYNWQRFMLREYTLNSKCSLEIKNTTFINDLQCFTLKFNWV